MITWLNSNGGVEASIQWRSIEMQLPLSKCGFLTFIFLYLAHLGTYSQSEKGKLVARAVFYFHIEGIKV